MKRQGDGSGKKKEPHSQNDLKCVTWYRILSEIKIYTYVISVPTFQVSLYRRIIKSATIRGAAILDYLKYYLIVSQLLS